MHIQSLSNFPYWKLLQLIYDKILKIIKHCEINETLKFSYDQAMIEGVVQDLMVQIGDQSCESTETKNLCSLCNKVQYYFIIFHIKSTYLFLLFGE